MDRGRGEERRENADWLSDAGMSALLRLHSAGFKQYRQAAGRDDTLPYLFRCDVVSLRRYAYVA
jgi:hypothetical protein